MAKRSKTGIKKGGAAPACLPEPDVKKYMNPCKGANIHNTNMIGGGCGCNKNKSLKNRINIAGMLQQSAGGSSVDVSQMIAGQPVINSYDDCCPPALIGGKLVSGAASGSQPVCGGQSGGKKSKKSKKAKKVKKTKKSKKAKKVKKTKKSKKAKKGQKGGRKSKPSEYPFKGDNSNFSQDMNEHTFDETQPDYSANAI